MIRQSLFYYATMSSNVNQEILLTLINAKIKVNGQNKMTGQTPLMAALNEGRDNIAKWLINNAEKYGIDVTIRDKNGENVSDIARTRLIYDDIH